MMPNIPVLNRLSTGYRAVRSFVSPSRAVCELSTHIVTLGAVEFVVVVSSGSNDIMAVHSYQPLRWRISTS